MFCFSGRNHKICDSVFSRNKSFLWSQNLCVRIFLAKQTKNLFVLLFTFVNRPSVLGIQIRHLKSYRSTSAKKIWVVDPDQYPDRIRIKLGSWIRFAIRIGIQESKNDPQKWKKVNKFNFLKCWMFCFEGSRLLLEACMSFMKTYGKVNCNFGSKRRKKFFSCTYFSFHFWYQYPESRLDPDPHSYPDPDLMKPDPQHC